VIVIRNTDEELDLNVSTHFKGSEFRCKCGMCPITMIDEDMLAAVEALRQGVRFPLAINSGFRCWVHNNVIGGKPYSWHLSGQACDVSTKGMSTKDKEAVIRFVHILFQYYYVGEGFVHMDMRGK
jgi:zinc D-Ala-D-Ala carboxypeptidase